MSSTLRVPDDSAVKKRVAKAVIDRIDELKATGNEAVYEESGFRLTTNKTRTEGGSMIEFFDLEGKKADGEFVRLFTAERAFVSGSHKYNILPTIFIEPFGIWSDKDASLTKFLGLKKLSASA